MSVSPADPGRRRAELGGTQDPAAKPGFRLKLLQGGDRFKETEVKYLCERTGARFHVDKPPMAAL